MMHYPYYFNSYKDSLVYKIFLKNPLIEAPITTLDQAWEAMEKINVLTGGMHQIVYLVGWQYEGHDSKYPSLGEVGTQCASSFSSDPREALRSLMRKARAQLNADVSFHINMNDAYMDSPDWENYIAHDAIAKDADGQLSKGGVWAGKQSYRISHLKEWNSGLARQRILGLLNLLPEIRDSHTIHIDAFFAQESPYDKITIDDDIEAMHKIVDFWHEQGIDVTAEFLASNRHLGYFPMIHHDNRDEWDRLMTPPDVLCGGSPFWNAGTGYDYYHRDGWLEHLLAPGRGCRFPEVWGCTFPFDIKAFRLDDMPSLIDSLFTQSIVSRFLNRFTPVKFTISHDEYAVDFTEGVRSQKSLLNNHFAITQDGRLVVEDEDVFVTFPYGQKFKLLAYSRNGITRVIELPPELASFQHLVCRKPLEGTEEILPVTDGKVALTLQPKTSAVLYAN